MIEGLGPTILVGVLGGAIAQLIQIAGALKAKSPPTVAEWFGSAIFAALGAGAVLYGTQAQSYLQVATLGAAFPLVFSASINAATSKKAEGGVLSGSESASRSLLDWLSGRIATRVHV